MSMQQRDFCLDVIVNDTQYQSTIANEFVVLAFFVCFIVTAIFVVLFVLYIIKNLKADRERERKSEKRRTMRQNAAKKAHADQIDDEDDSSGRATLETNYIWSVNEGISNRENAERSQSKISFYFDENKHHSPASSEDYDLEILAALFTSNKNSSSTSSLNNCLWLRESCFELIKSFHREAFSALLNLMLTALLEEKKVNEIEKLKLITKYEQMVDEELTNEEVTDSTCKLHCVLKKIENEIQEMIGSEDQVQETWFSGERLSKYLMVIQREILSHHYDDVVKEMILNTENSMIKIIGEKWFNLEVIRFRISVVHDSIEEILKKKGEKKDVIQDYLNEYIKNVFEKLNEFCIAYEKDISDLISQIKKDKEMNRKQAIMELEAQRFTQRSNAMQVLDFSKKKAVSKFVVSQIDAILNDFKTISHYQLVVNSESFELFEDFQKGNDKRVVKVLRNCEEELFDKLQKDEIISEENLIEIGKALSSNLKDFKMAEEKLKEDFLQKGYNSTRQVANVVDSLYSMLEKNFTKGVEDMKKEYLEILHSLSNIDEQEMNKLEHNFHIGFSCLSFSLHFIVMMEINHKIHAILSDKIRQHAESDISLSLHDMVQILKQDKSVISKSSLFSLPNKELYLIIEKEMSNSIRLLAFAVDDYLKAIAKKMDHFFLQQVNIVIQNTILRQSQLCVSNLYVAREKLLSCSMNSKGYMSKQASSLAKDCFEQIRSIWESQANFKAHKLQESKDEIMRGFDPVIETFFNSRNEGNAMREREVSFHRTLRSEQEYFISVEELVRGDSVERVVDSNLENEIMVIKLHDKFECYEHRVDDVGTSQRRNLRSQKSHDSDGGSRRRKESLRHSISRKSKKQ